MEAILTLLIPVTFVLMLVLERVLPARPLPKVRGWWLKGIVFFIGGGVISTIIPAVLARVAGANAPLPIEKLGVVPAGIIGALATDFIFYGLHRFVHNTPWLWRWTHQMHHSAERVDILGGAYFHPFDYLFMSIPTAIVAVVSGISPDAAALAGYIGFVAAFIPHLNVRTPQWLGWIVQRPEAHSVHHARGVHAYNYGNFPFWDMIFGTYRNPVGFTDPAGFWDGASAKLTTMLMGRDVAEPEIAPLADQATAPSASMVTE
jgi:sterol desaturase/sphingolipid hydroxylase (fatty acid hydroxylase superfamily)